MACSSADPGGDPVTRAARFVATVTSHGCATPDQALRALEIAQGIGLDMRAQLARVRTPAARQRIMVAGNRRLTAQICALMEGPMARVLQ